MTTSRGFNSLACPTYRNGNGLLTPDLFHCSHEVFKVFRFPEILVDAGEADVGDAVQPLQALHHHFADSLGLHLTFAAGFKLALDSGDEFFHADRIDRSLAAGDLHGTGQLFAVERLATARSGAHTSELQSLMRSSYAVFCLKQK